MLKITPIERKAISILFRQGSFESSLDNQADVPTLKIIIEHTLYNLILAGETLKLGIKIVRADEDDFKKKNNV